MKHPFLLLTLISFFVIGCDSTNQPASTVNNDTEIVMPSAETTEDQTTDATETTQAASTTPVAIEAPAEMLEQTAELTGEQVYTKSCANCHKAGVAGAPKLGDAAAWSVRTAKGIDTLYNSAKVGMPGTAMMAKGTCTACSDSELNAAVDYMIEESK